MSRFFSEKYAKLVPYTPGEQPRERKYIKLNTNESPFPPSPQAVRRAAEEAERLQLYSDPTCADLVQAACAELGVRPDEILFTNGSDEILNFAFMAFADAGRPAYFADVTYGFYPVFADLNGVPYEEIPLCEDFSIRPEDYFGKKGLVVIANPNAPTGLLLPLEQIERIAAANPESVVLVDEAYIDFGGQSALPLIRRYDNLLVVQTFSKSRSMAGARLGFGAGNPALIRDLNTIKYSVNPYNVNRMTMAAGVGALEDEAYFRACCAEIIENRAWTLEKLRALGFEAIDSMANFVFARHGAVPGAEIYARLREKGVLVRHFDKPRLRDYNRITIGSAEQMQALIGAMEEILGETR
ncbi:MAG: histidinol-phosphate transaminase [Eubacteriales bacterium]|nr:histidinol-phosphate transaminase [Eubacteriales bacterium]